MLFRQELTGYTKNPGSYVKGRWEEGEEILFNFFSSVQPLKGDQLESLPQGRRSSKSYNLYTDKLMNCVLSDKNPDIVILFNERYEVYKREQWQNNIVSYYNYIVIKLDIAEPAEPVDIIIDFDKKSPEEFAIDLTFTDGIVTLSNLSDIITKYTWLVTSPTVTQVYLSGAKNTVVPKGSKIKSDGDDTLHAFMEDVIISPIDINTCLLVISLVEDETEYSITISDSDNLNPITYAYTTGIDTTVDEIVHGLLNVIGDSDFSIVVTPENYILFTNYNANFSMDVSYQISFYNVGNVRALIEGESVVNPYDLIIIEDVIEGFNAVFNFDAGVSGNIITEDKADLTDFIFTLISVGYYTIELTGYNESDEIIGTEKKVDYLTAYSSPY
jgi:hypothetical protein